MVTQSRSVGDGYLNPFHVYGSSHQEDNFTRAWLSTLRALAPAHARLFIRDVLLSDRPDLQRRIDFSAREGLEFDFQIEDIDGEAPELGRDEGALVTIDASDDDELSFASTPPDRKARPDGLIVDPGSEVTLIIEVKLFGGQQSSQLSRHHAAFFDTSSSTPEDVRTAVKWTKVADFLDNLRDRGASELERYVLSGFVEYAEHLGLAPFRGFRLRHFEERDNVTLRKYVRAVKEELQAAGIESEWDEDTPKRVFFPDRRDNVYVRFDGTEGFSFGIVSGSGSKRTCAFFKASLEERREQLHATLEDMANRVQDVIVGSELWLRPHIRAYYSMYRKWLTSLPDRYPFPQGFDGFCGEILDSRRNPLDRMSRQKLTEVFHDVINAQDLDLGPDDLFPPPPDAEPVLVHLYPHFDVIVPADRLRSMQRNEAIDKGKDICTVLYEVCGELEEIY